MRTGTKVTLDKGTWTLAEKLGEGGFGEVYRGQQGADQAAIKFIPRNRGVPREVLLSIPEDARNVVPISDTGEDAANWIVAMPVADTSLDKFVRDEGGRLPEETAVTVLADVADALVSLHGKIVHRDIKPGNILLFGGKWCLSDFGIARDATAATATETHKGKGTAEYHAPELWRGGSATSQSDMYALGVVAYEMLTGRQPFTGSDDEIYQGHAFATPKSMGAPARLDWVIMDCLKKDPQLRPTAEQFRDRLGKSLAVFDSAAAKALADANQTLRTKQDEAEEANRKIQAAAELRQQQVAHAGDLLSRISHELLTTLEGLAELAVLHPGEDGRGRLTFGRANLVFSQMLPNNFGHLSARDDDPFEVLATAYIEVRQDVAYGGYAGRSHALWYADVNERGKFEWYETAFMQNGGVVPLERLVPFGAEFESEEASAALRGEGRFVVAWPFTAIDADDMEEFRERWGLWFAKASQGTLELELPDPSEAQTSRLNTKA